MNSLPGDVESHAALQIRLSAGEFQDGRRGEKKREGKKTYQARADSENEQIHHRQEHLPRRGEILAPVQEQPENASQAVCQHVSTSLEGMLVADGSLTGEPAGEEGHLRWNVSSRKVLVKTRA